MTGQPLSPALLDAEVTTEGGQRVRLRELVRGATLLVFLRQFGCPFCSLQVDALAKRLFELDAVGIAVVLIGNGSPSSLDEFIERQGLRGRRVTAVTDESLATYDAAGLVRSAAATHDPRSLFAELQVMARGYFPRRRAGSANQLGGAILVGDDGRILYEHKSERLGDLPDASDIVARALAHFVDRRAGEARV